MQLFWQRVMDSASKKTCKMCCMDIPLEARKCPHCQHFLKRAQRCLLITNLCGNPGDTTCDGFP